MTTRPYTALIPGSIGAVFYRDATQPCDPNQPSHLWRDNLVAQSLWYAPMTGPRKYKTLARNADGSPKLTPIAPVNGDYTAYQRFYDTYSVIPNAAVIHAYQEFAFLFPSGVPYLEDLVVDAPQVLNINLPAIGARPTWDYPIDQARLSDQMLLVQNGEVVCVNYQDFAAANRPKLDTNAEKMQAIRAVIAAGGTDDNLILMITKIVTSATFPQGGLT